MTAWLDDIADLLKPAFGTHEQKVAVWRVAQEMDQLPAVGMADTLRSAFRAFVHGMGWLHPVDEQPLMQRLPPLESIPRESKAMRDRRLDDRAEAVERRVCHAVEALVAGWSGEESRAFVATEEEWSEALRRRRREVAI